MSRRRRSTTNPNTGSSRKNRRNRLQIARIKELLRQEGFDRVEMLRDEDVANTLEFPSRKDIEDVLRLTRDYGLFRQTPKTLKRLEEYGLVLPYDVQSAIETRGKQHQRRKDPMSVLQDYEYSEAKRITLKDYFQIARDGGNPDEIETNSGTVKVADLRRELYNEFVYHLTALPAGERFETEYMEMQREVLQDFNNNQIIALYGIFDSGNLFSNFTDFDSNNDGVNTRGLYTLKQHMSDARSYR